MAMLAHRLRRVLVAVPSFFQRSFSVSRSSNFTSVPSLLPRSVVKQPTEFGRYPPARLFSTTQYQYDPYTGEDSFTPDNEGCDFNHWLITMDFPKENPPSREEMISIFEQTCAKRLGISLEEAKKKIYAICTTSYQGFQATMTIGEVEKFRDLPGVQYIIPDSYVDVENKMYGGDKYENGVITPGPIPAPTRESFNSLEKEKTPGQEQVQDEGPTSGQVQERRIQMPSDQRSFEQGQGKLALRQGQGQENRMSISGQGLDRGQGSQMSTPKQGRDRMRGSQMSSFQGSLKNNQGSFSPGQGQAQGNQRPSFREGYSHRQGTPINGNGPGQGSQIPPQRIYNQGQTTPTPRQGQENQITSCQVGYTPDQAAQTPPNQRLPSNYGQGALMNYNQGPPQGKFMQETQEYYKQVDQGNQIPQSGGNYGSAQGTGSPGLHGYAGHEQYREGPLLAPHQGSYNQGHGTLMPGQEQGGQIPSYQMGYSQGVGAPVPPYQGNFNRGPAGSYGQWAFVNYSQGQPHGNFLQGPQPNYNQGGQWNFSPQNGGHYGPAQFGQGYPGHAPCQGNYMPQYQLSYNQSQGAPFPGQWQCQRCGMPSYPGSYNQGQGTPNPGQWQGQGYVMPSYQASYSQAQGAPRPPFQRNYNHGIPTSYGQGTSAHVHQAIPVNYTQMGQGDHNPHSSGNYGPVHGAAKNPGFQQDRRNVAGDWSDNNNHADLSETSKIPH